MTTRKTEQQIARDVAHIVRDERLLEDGAESRTAVRVASLSAAESPRIGVGDVQLFLRSLAWAGGALYAIARTGDARWCVVVAADRQAMLPPFRATEVATGSNGELRCLIAPLTAENTDRLGEVFPWTRPTSLRDRPATVGLGDRLGVATPGHIRAVRAFDVAPVFAQQSMRECTLLRRDYRAVVADASWAVFQEGYRDGFGADGDHLKTIDQIDVALAAGMPMITLDLTEVMRPEVADWSDEAVAEAFADLPAQERTRLSERWVGRPLVTDDGSHRVELDEAELMRCAVMYGPAITFSAAVSRHLRAERGDHFDLEISIDETTTPTMPAHHLFIAGELRDAGVEVNSIAPRFIGEFQKGIDYIGDVVAFGAQFVVHAAIASSEGRYKLSVHSGSDKFSVFPTVGSATAGRFHLKTSGTSWLEALATAAEYDPALYRRLHRHARDNAAKALALYHISASFDAVADVDATTDADLPRFLDDPNCRQMLHISYGEIMGDAELGPALRRFLHTHDNAYAMRLNRHISRHLSELGVPARAE